MTEGTACVGVDLDALAENLTKAVGVNPLLAPIATPLLNQVLAALGAQDLNSLLEVKRISDTVIQLVPTGTLATLQGLLGPIINGVASGSIARRQIS